MNENTLADHVVGTWDLVDPIDPGYHTCSAYNKDGTGRDVISFPDTPDRPSEVIDFIWKVSEDRLSTISTMSTTSAVPKGMCFTYEVVAVRSDEMSCKTVFGPDVMIGFTSRYRRMEV